MHIQRCKLGAMPALLLGGEAERLYLYLHGQGGSKEEALAFGRIACAGGWQVLAIDLPGHGERAGEASRFYPWHIVPELRQVMGFARTRWRQIALYANSIGAYLGMCSFAGEELARSLFVSPVLDMARLIGERMRSAGVEEARLAREGQIPVDDGPPLSWEYLTYARAHPITRWESPTFLLYAGQDHLTSRDTVENFARHFGCRLTVMEEGEHWFHTPPQLAVLDAWTRAHFDCPQQ